jgi:hypothetical protein
MAELAKRSLWLAFAVIAAMTSACVESQTPEANGGWAGTIKWTRIGRVNQNSHDDVLVVTLDGKGGARYEARSSHHTGSDDGRVRSSFLAADRGDVGYYVGYDGYGAWQVNEPSVDFTGTQTTNNGNETVTTQAGISLGGDGAEDRSPRAKRSRADAAGIGQGAGLYGNRADIV